MKHYVFIDSSIYISQNFTLNSRVFERLKQLCITDKVVLVICSVTRREIYSNIEKNVNESVRSTTKILSKNILGKNIEPYKSLSREIQEDVIATSLKRKFDEYLSSTNHINIGIANVSVDKIFDDYFNSKPPFGENKKKSEFPDAFVVLALHDWCQSNNQSMAIISSDSDFKNAVSSNDEFVYFSSLQKYIEHILSDDSNLVEIFHHILEKNKERLSKKIIEQISGDMMILEDVDPDGEAYIETADVIDYMDIAIIELNDDKAIVNAMASIDLTVNLNCYDPDSWVRDADGDIHYREKIEGLVERDVDIEAEFHIQFDKDDISNFSIIKTVVNDNEPISFFLKEFIY